MTTDPWEGTPQTTEDGRPLHCDRCGEPVLTGQALYTVTYDDEKALARHWECHERLQRDFTESLDRAKKAIAEGHRLVAELRRRGL